MKRGGVKGTGWATGKEGLSLCLLLVGPGEKDHEGTPVPLPQNYRSAPSSRGPSQSRLDSAGFPLPLVPRTVGAETSETNKDPDMGHGGVPGEGPVHGNHLNLGSVQGGRQEAPSSIAGRDGLSETESSASARRLGDGRDPHDLFGDLFFSPSLMPGGP